MSLHYLNANSDEAHVGINNPAGGFYKDQIQWLNNTNWLEFVGGGPSDYVAGWETFTLGATQRCKSVRLFVNIASFFAIWLENYFLEVGNPSAGSVNAGVTLSGPIGETVVAYNPQVTAPGGGEWTQTKINNLGVQFHQGSTLSQLILFDALVELDVRNKPVVTSVTAPTGAQSTRKPTVIFARNMNDSDVQKKFQVKVFRSDIYGGGGFNPDTSPAAYTSTQLNGSATSHALASMIGDGTFKAYVRVAKDFNGQDWWSDWLGQSGTFTITNPPPLPINITPLNASTQSTDRPILGGTVVQPTLLARSRIEWQLATDAAFTTNLRTVIEPITDVRLTGPTSEITTAVAELFQTSWYLRARQVDEFGATSAGWTVPQQFTVSHIPSTSNWIPTGGQSVRYGSELSINFVHDWVFGDPSPYDFQTAYQIVVEYNESGVVYSDTGKITSGNSQGSVLYDPSVKDTMMRWKVRVWDSDDVVGPYSSYQLFVPGDPPEVQIFQPADGGDYNNPIPVALWTVTIDGGRTQTERRVLVGPGTIGDPGDFFYDSGWQAGTDTNFNTGDQLFEHDNFYWLEVQVRDNTGLEGTDRVYFRAFWDLPDTPDLKLWLEDMRYDGHTTLTWDGSATDGAFVRYELRKRIWGASPTADWEIIYSTDEQLDHYEIHDWMVGVYKEYEWSLTQWAVRFGIEVAAVWDIEMGRPEADDYWLIHPTDKSKSLLLHHVTDDSMKEEYETEIQHLIGRGRHQDIGDRLGWSGSLSAHLRDRQDLSGREQRLALEALKAERVDLWLRNPFGDLFRVAAGDIEIDREAGVGSGDREFSEVSFDYVELLDE